MSRVLITGIEGFAGKHLAALLLEQGKEVWGTFLHDQPTDPNLILKQADVRDLDTLSRVVAECRPQQLVHLAAVSSVADSENQAVTTYEVNATGTIKLFEALRINGLKPRILLISSANIYGPAVSSAQATGRPATPLTEESPVRPLSPYALSKLACEQVGSYYHITHGFEVITLRPFSHTGPGQAPAFVFSSAARRIAEIELLRDRQPGPCEDASTLEMGNLDVRRDYTDVRDIVRAYALALEHCRPGVTYNVTSGRPILIRDGIETLCRTARYPVKTITSLGRLRPNDLPLLTGDPTRFQAATGWQPEIPFEQTLADLLDYWREWKD